MKKLYELAVILSAQDKMTKTVNAAFDKVQRGLKTVARNSAIVGLAVAAPLVYAADKAIAFEDKMADVGKTMNLKTGSDGLNQVGKDVRQMSIYLAKAQEDTAGLYAALAQGGVVQDQLNRTAKIAGTMAVAYDMAAEVAGDKFIKIKNALGATTEVTEKLADTMNYLSDKEAAKASQLVDFFSAGGASATNMLRISPQVSAAFGTMFISAGKSGEEAATIFERFTKGVMKGNNAASKTFNAKGGGLNGLLAVIEQGRKLSGQKQFQFFKAFGEYGPEVAQMANNYQVFQRVLGEAMDTQAQAGSMQKEFGNRMETTKTKLMRAKAQFDNLAIIVGTKLLPVLTPLIEKASAFIERISVWMDANPKLTKQLVFGAVAVSGIAFAVSGLTTIINGAVSVFRVFRTVQIALNVAMLANPVGLIIAAVVALVAIVVLAWQKCEGFRRVIGGLSAVFVEFHKMAWQFFIKPVWDGIKALWAFGKSIRERILNPIQNMPSAFEKSFPLIWAIFEKTGKVIKMLFIDPIIFAINLIKKIPGVKELGGRISGAYQKGSDWGATATIKMPVILGGEDTAPKKGNALDFGKMASNKSTSLSYAPVINIAGNADANSRLQMEQMLQQHKAGMLRMIDETMSRRERSKF